MAGIRLGGGYGAPRAATATSPRLSAQDRTIQRIQDCVEKLRIGSPIEQTDAASTLGKLAYRNPENKRRIAEAGAIPSLIELCRSGSEKANEEAVDALGNLANNHPENKRRMVAEGVLPPLVELLSSEMDQVKKAAAHTLESLASFPENQRLIANAGAIPPLVTLLTSGTLGIEDACAARALQSLAYNNLEIQVEIAKHCPKDLLDSEILDSEIMNTATLEDTAFKDVITKAISGLERTLLEERALLEKSIGSIFSTTHSLPDELAPCIPRYSTLFDLKAMRQTCRASKAYIPKQASHYMNLKKIDREIENLKTYQ